jgi:hypothetical protein
MEPIREKGGQPDEAQEKRIIELTDRRAMGTLPPGEDRDATLKTIYQRWPKEDPAAKEAFKQQHGIEW